MLVISPRSWRRAAAMAVLTATLVAPAAAETLTVTDISKVVQGHFRLSVPSVVAEDANLSEEQIRGLFFANDTTGQGENLARLEAVRVSIPEIAVSWIMLGSTSMLDNLTVSGVEIANVQGGVAGEVSIEKITVAGKMGRSFEVGPIKVSNLNVDYLLHTLGFYAGTTRNVSEIESLFQGLLIENAKLASHEGTCEIGRFEAGPFAFRWLNGISLAEISALQGKSSTFYMYSKEPDPSKARADDIARLQSYYYDLLSAYDAAPVTVAGLTCNVPSGRGQNVLVDVANLTWTESHPGLLPALAADNIRIENEGEGWLAVERIETTTTDYNNILEAFAEQGSAVTGQWVAENTRRLLPEFGGFTVSGVSTDLPDSSNPGQRIQMTIGGLEFRLADYVAGLPTVVETSTSGFHLAVPEGPQGAALTQLGLTEIGVDYNVAIRWDRAAQTVTFDDLKLTLADAGSVQLSGTLGNVKPSLFSFDPNQTTAAAQALTVKDLTIEIDDAGIGERLIAMTAAQQNIEPEQFRAAIGAMVQGTVLIGLAGSPDSVGVSQALAAFINGAPHLRVSISAKAPGGAPVMALQTAGNDPGALLKLFNITAESADAAAVPEEPATTDAAPEGEATPERKDKSRG